MASSLVYQRTVIGYHGCDVAVVKKVLEGAPLNPSNKPYDWLGRGIYFWEYGRNRAAEWANERALRGDTAVTTPSVLGAYIHLGECFDLLDTANTDLLSDLFPGFERFLKDSGKKIPKNAPLHEHDEDHLLRNLDCAFLNWALDRMKEKGHEYHTVRGAFVEGNFCYPGARIKRKTHIQIAVRDPKCIIGFFRPSTD